MAIPDFQTLMLPLMRLVADGKEQTLSGAIEELAQQFRLTDDERRELLPSGRQSKFDNRVGWTQTHLKKAELLDRTGRGRFCITQRGLELLRTNPTTINIGLLSQFPEYQTFRTSSRQSSKQNGEVAEGISSNQHSAQSSVLQELAEVEALRQTPQETLEASYQLLRRNLAQELLERVKSSSPRFFERLVVDLLVSMGYGGSRKDAGQAVGQSGDGGIDGIIKEDRLGLDAVYIQAKRWEGTVGRPTVQGFAGSLEGQRARKGVLITTSQFSQDAKDYVSRIEKKIVLIDGEQLAQYMIDFGVGVAEEATYIIKKVDGDYFGDE